jgi:hypothetical protein
MEAKKYVRCIKAGTYITAGKEYEVMGCGEGFFRIIDDWGDELRRGESYFSKPYPKDEPTKPPAQNGYTIEQQQFINTAAIAAMQAIVKTQGYSPYDVMDDAMTADEVAKQSYLLAIAMLNHRNTLFANIEKSVD